MKAVYTHILDSTSGRDAGKSRIEFRVEFVSIAYLLQTRVTTTGLEVVRSNDELRRCSQHLSTFMSDLHL